MSFSSQIVSESSSSSPLWVLTCQQTYSKFFEKKRICNINDSLFVSPSIKRSYLHEMITFLTAQNTQNLQKPHELRPTVVRSYSSSCSSVTFGSFAIKVPLGDEPQWMARLKLSVPSAYD